MPRIKPTPKRWAATQRVAQARFASRFKRKNARRTIQRAWRRYKSYKTARMAMNRSLGTNLSRRIGSYL